MPDQLTLWDDQTLTTNEGLASDWLEEVRAGREQRREHQLLVGAALRAELAEARRLGKAARHRRRLQLLAARQREST